MSKTNINEKKSIVPKLPRILLTIPAALLFVIGLSGENGPFGPGSVIDAFMNAQATDEVLQLRMQGTAVLGMVLFSLFITYGGFRLGQRWAWYALWYWPIFFILHIVAFGTWIPDLPLAILTVIALLLPYRRFFPRNHEPNMLEVGSN